MVLIIINKQINNRVNSSWKLIVFSQSHGVCNFSIISLSVYQHHLYTISNRLLISIRLSSIIIYLYTNKAIFSILWMFFIIHRYIKYVFIFNFNFNVYTVTKYFFYLSHSFIFVTYYGVCLQLIGSFELKRHTFIVKIMARDCRIYFYVRLVGYIIRQYAMLRLLISIFFLLINIYKLLSVYVLLN